MAYKKIMVAVDCDTEQEQQLLQVMAKELSETLRLKAKDLISFYPVLQKHRGLIYSAMQTISREGKKGLLKLIPMLMRQM